MSSTTSPSATNKSASSLSMLLKDSPTTAPSVVEFEVDQKQHDPDPLVISRHFVQALNECDWGHWSNRHFSASFRAKHDNSKSELTWEEQHNLYKGVRARFPKYHMEILSESVDLDEANGRAVVWHFIRITGAPEDTQRDGLGMVKGANDDAAAKSSISRYCHSEHEHEKQPACGWSWTRASTINDSTLSSPSLHKEITFASMGYLKEGTELKSESGKTYLAVSSLGQANVWTGVENTGVGKDDFSKVVVLKAPSEDDEQGTWTQFVHEMIMHELFKEAPHIRKQIDRIAPDKDKESPPVLVLEIFETTLWQARTKRPLSRLEIVAITRSILEALQVIHANGLVYADLKMENVLMNGFDPEAQSHGSCLSIKLGDLGAVMYPASGTAQPIAYRAPEVFFKEEITPAADIWAVGLIYSHLLEARNSFSETGLYDDMNSGSESMDERVQAMRHALANDYDLMHVPYYKDCELPHRDEDHARGNHWENLRKKGMEELDVAFLQRILKANPKERPSAKAILASQWFAGGLLAREFLPVETDGAGDQLLWPDIPEVSDKTSG
ncbi:hypothetical protein PRZ48_011016 [Zasmidium cellare]|uniref:Protein kinase domain-containing protein n=1 Tax=Zasmidium cellare TaxID=395010 RepID=A0ABR0EB48_ZASCE|nr:hypothetical protein PRZ48_011016 [Zasmidium cellare]